MSDPSKSRIYTEAWHADVPYDRLEAIRLAAACEMIKCHAPWPGEVWKDGASTIPDRREVLDIGCGVGPLRAYLPAAEFRIVGTDLSPAAVEVAKRHYDDAAVADVEADWPFPDASFDAVHAGAVLEHVLDWHAPLNHANRVLRDGGLLVVTTPNLRYWKELKRLLRGRQPHWLSDMGHVHGYTPRFLKAMLALHGFEVAAFEADRLGLPLLPRHSRFACRALAGWGSVMILAAALRRRTRVEDDSRAAEFPAARNVGLRSIEVP